MGAESDLAGDKSDRPFQERRLCAKARHFAFCCGVSWGPLSPLAKECSAFLINLVHIRFAGWTLGRQKWAY